MRVLAPFIAPLVVLSTSVPSLGGGASRPNILWIVAEDLCPDFGCYGNRDVSTPHIDGFATEGRLYRKAFATSPVCSPSRSALITGMYQTSIGAHHHRSHRSDGYQLPADVKLLPERLREADYFCVRVTELPADMEFRASPKVDWNFTSPENVWDSESWSDLKTHQPFFAQVNLGEAHRPYKGGVGPAIDPEKVTTLPPYIADHPVCRRDWADYLKTLQSVDAKVGRILTLLSEEGLRENTIVCFFADNGREDFRGKSTAFAAGVHVPLIIRWPGKLAAGSRSDELVSLIDLTASAVVLAGLQLPDEMHGMPFLATSSPRRQFIFTARDRIETAVDRVRTVYDGRYRYIRNFLPDRPHLMERRYYDRTNPVRDVMRELHVQGKLTPEQAKVFAPERPAEELYDLKKDRFELHDLSTSEAAKHESALARLRSQLTQWTAETGDLGDQPEPTEAVDATRGRRKKRPRVDPEAPPARESPALDPAPSFESRRPARPLGR